jgi:hypothetical protein
MGAKVGGWKGGGHVHQTNGYFEHVVAQRKVAEAVPCACSASAHAALGIVEVFLRVLVEARHSCVLCIGMKVK